MPPTQSCPPASSRRPALPSITALNVLLIDDDPFMLELVAGMLRKMGVSRIAVASDGERGAAALANAPDLIVCDLNMPGRDGFQVMEAMAASRFMGGVILLSGMDARTRNSAALMGRFHHLNVLGVMNKPISRPDLAVMLTKICV